MERKPFEKTFWQAEHTKKRERREGEEDKF
jgi:hypothetical protein